jgi:hypothetical protein
MQHAASTVARFASPGCGDGRFWEGGLRHLLLLCACAALLGGCGSKTACYALSDEDAALKVIGAYGRLPATSKGDPAQMQFSPTRVVGVGRNRSDKGDGKGLTQVWFTQDDHTVTVATLTEACDLQFRPGLTPDAIKQAVIPVHAPNF